MKIIKINSNKISPDQADFIVDYLKSGRTMAYPTDTVYGLGCDARNAKAIEKINKIKERTDPKPFLVLISDLKMLEKYCFANFEQIEYLKTVWPASSAGGPGPVTAILKRRRNLPSELSGGLDSIAVRLPKNDFLVKIIRKAGFPIVSTSLNIKGGKPLADVENLEKYFKFKPDLAVDAGKCGKIKPSRLVDIRDMENIKVLRK
ncbi:MAG: L-threonylcarbamoyladenylate synthase [bacterium]